MDRAAEHVLDMPGWRPLLTKTGRTVLIVSLLPMAVFYVTLSAAGLRWAVTAALGWYYLGILATLARRRPVLSASAVGAALLTVRTAVTYCTGSAAVYFLQPAAGTVAMAVAFGVTAAAARPLMERLAHDFCPFPPHTTQRLREVRFFRHLSLVWAASYLLNAALTVWLLTNASLTTFLLFRAVFSPLLTASTAVVSYGLFRWLLRRDGLRVRWGGPAVPAGTTPAPS